MLENEKKEADPRSGLQVVTGLVGKLNLADYQNAVPALTELTVVNQTDLAYEDLTVSVSSEPSFFKPKQWHIAAIAPGQTSRLSSLDLQLDGPLLARLSESEFARVKFEIKSTGPESPALCSCEQDIELLPRNQWGGLSHLPEMIAAFIQPNDPAIGKLLKKAAQLLRESDRNPSLNGYESGPKHAWEILSAIWGAIASQKLDYALPPASFEQHGQKIRSPMQVLDSGLGTCLDLAVLFAAVAEQAGLNPLVLFIKDHAFAGCWLRSEQFATTVVDDPSALRKRLLLKEIVLVETTIATGQSIPSFSRACEIGSKLISEDATAPFEAAVDIRRARWHLPRPLRPGHKKSQFAEPRSGSWKMCRICPTI